MNNSKCKYYSKMLHLFELGLLSDNMEKEFFLHIMDCEKCLNDVREFVRVSQQLRHNPDVSRAILNLVQESDHLEDIQNKELKKWNLVKSKWRPSFSIGLILIIAIILIIVIPFKLEFQSSQEAVADENIIAIMHFNNLADPVDANKYEDIVTNLLITDLSQSQFIRVVSSQRMYDIFKQLKIEDISSVDNEQLLSIARQSNARWMVNGNLVQLEPNVVITTQLIDVSTGNILASNRHIGYPDSNIFNLVDMVSAKIKNDLSLPDQAYLELDNMVADATTNSETAYRFYIEGLNFFYRYDWNNAFENFSYSLQFDSTFAMAYYYLSRLLDKARNESMIRKAKEYSNNIGDMEKRLIDIRYATIIGEKTNAMNEIKMLINEYPDEKYPHLLIAGYHYSHMKYDEAIQHIESSLKIDPLYAEAYNMLAYIYINMDEKEKAKMAVDKYHDLAPNLVNTLESKAEIYARCGLFDESIVLFQEVLQKMPQFNGAREKLGRLYLFNNDYKMAEKYYNDFSLLHWDKSIQYDKLLKSYILLNQGKIKQALKNLEIGIEGAQKNVVVGNWEDGVGGLMNLVKLRVHKDYLGDISVLAAVERCIEIKDDYRSTYYQNYLVLYIELLADKRLFQKAEEATRKLKNFLEDYERSLHSYWYCLGYVDYIKEDYKGAINNFSKAAHWNKDFKVHLRYADALAVTGNFDKAIPIYKALISDFGLWKPLWAWARVKCFYKLAEALEKSGNFEDAIDYYEIFLKKCNEADSGIIEEEKAKENLTRIKNLN